MEAAIAMIFSSLLPFSGCLFRRLNSNHSSKSNDYDQSIQCNVPSKLVKYLSFGIGYEHLFLQIMMLTLHTTNALLLMMILKKILGSRKTYIAAPTGRICTYIAVAAMFAAHSTRTALLNDVDGDLSLIFLIAVVVSLSGTFLTMNTNGHFQPTVTATLLLVVGIVFVIITLSFGDEKVLMSSPPIDSSSSYNNAKTSPLHSISILSPSRFIASTQQLLWTLLGLFPKGIDFVRNNTILQPPTVTGTLKILQSVLNIFKAQLYLPVNVDNGYIQTQRDALELLWDTQLSRSQSIGVCRSGNSDGSKMISTLRCAASVISRLSTDYAPVVELTFVILLVGYILFSCIQHQLHSLRQHSQLTLAYHINPFGITSIVLVTISCCLNVCFSSNSSSNNKDLEMLVLSRQSYVPSAFMSVCLAVALADAWAAQLLVLKETTSAAGDSGIGNDSLLLTGMQGQSTASLLQSLTRIVLRLRPGRIPGDSSSRIPPSLTTAAAAAVDKSTTRRYWLVKALQLLSLSVLIIIADTLYKSFHPDEPRCFFRTTATREMEFFCCPTI